MSLSGSDSSAGVAGLGGGGAVNDSALASALALKIVQVFNLFMAKVTLN